MYDLIIIGGGPAGVTAAIYASRAHLDTLWLDDRFVPGGQISDSALVDNYPGLPSVTGAELGDRFAAHAEGLGLKPLREKVLSIEKTSCGAEDPKGAFVLKTRKNTYESRTVILAAGAAHRHLDIPGEEELSGMGVSYCATCDGAFFRDRTAAVIGGGNTACEDALFLSRMCRQVYLVHRRDMLRADAVLRDRVQNCENIRVIWNSVPEKIEGDSQVSGLVLKNRVSGEENILVTEGVFIAVGMTPNSGLVRELAETDEAAYVCAGEDCATSMPGLYVAGDVRTKMLRQVVTATADGANAVASVQRYLG